MKEITLEQFIDSLISIRVKPGRHIDDSYHLYLGLSSDTLVVLDREWDILESIIDGKDSKGLVVSAETEDDFLDGINLFKNAINSGINPMCFLRT